MLLHSRRQATMLAVVAMIGAVASIVRADSIKVVQPSPAQKLFTRGVAALEGNDLAAAEKAFQESLKLEPKSAGAMLGLAQVALRRGDRTAASAYIQRAYATAPDNVEVQRNWARYEFSEGKPDEAKAALEAARQMDAKAAGPRVDLGDLYMIAFRKPNDAVVFYKEAIAIDPKHAGAHYALGVALERSGDEKGAIDELTQAATLNTTNPLPYYELGRLHESKGRLDAADTAFVRALQAKPSFAPAMVERGNILMARNDDVGAIRELSAALKADPTYAPAQLMLGMIHQRRAEWSDAETAYRAATRLDPNLAIAFNNLAWMAAERKVGLNEALAWAQKAVSLGPKVSEFQTTLGWVLRARGDLVRSVEALTRATTMTPDRAEAFYYLGIARLDQGKRAEGAAALKKALALNPKFQGAHDAQRRLKALGE
jgi:Tfp pilus assembly protein PilF